MRYILITLALSMFLFNINSIQAFKKSEIEEDQRESIIIEVEGDPHKAKEYLHTYQPEIEIVTVYDQLFNGIAIKADADKLSRLSNLEFIKTIHPVQTYKTTIDGQQRLSPIKSMETFRDNEQIVLPQTLNNTSYTGRGVKVGVIDTGIDMEHPDLKHNYQGGYDLVDLDEDPSETPTEQGMPTLHGSHVAGIIAGNGALMGVAPEADIYAYRALGPGGMGTSIQIIAALEQAVRDKVDVINLSLGNDVNGPDYPTSVAVNQAAKRGISIVIANGNSGPDEWTVGSPATASKALSVGAAEQLKHMPYLYEPRSDEVVKLIPFMGSAPWQLAKDYRVTEDEDKFSGNIALIKRGDIPFYQLAENAEQKGAEAVLIYNNKEEGFQGTIAHDTDPITIPVAQISKQHGEWLRKEGQSRSMYLKTKYKEQPAKVADFSSRGPVTVNWRIKPDILAPGTDIVSSVPGGYQALQGTSMAAPHVAGAVALMKEARPQWTNEQIVGALKTTALQMRDDDRHMLNATVQGLGLIDPKEAINTPTIIDEPALSFGKVTHENHQKSIDVTIENMVNQSQTYRFNIPRKQKGISWQLPQSFTLKKNEKTTIPIKLNANSQLLDEGMHEGWLTLEGDHQSYKLPYLFINKTVDQPKAMGFDFSVKPLSDDDYSYQLYITEETKSVDVTLYNPDTLVNEQHLLRIEEPDVGLNEGTISASTIKKPGSYLAVVTVELKNGDHKSYESMIFIDP